MSSQTNNGPVGETVPRGRRACDLSRKTFQIGTDLDVDFHLPSISLSRSWHRSSVSPDLL